MPGAPRVCWIDGDLRPLGEAALPADDSAFSEGRGCYTSARVAAGSVRFADRHVARLASGAAALGLPPPDPRVLHRALAELATAAFGEGDGVVRLQLSRDPRGALHVVGVPRELGPDGPRWRAVTAPFPHTGRLLAGGPKLTNRLLLALAGDAARRADADEALLFDGDGRLVEGSRSNVVALDADGRLVTPPAERGAVAGVALTILVERLPELCRRDLSRRGVRAARGVVAVNAVRGARALVSLDGEVLGEEGDGLAARLDAVLAEA